MLFLFKWNVLLYFHFLWRGIFFLLLSIHNNVLNNQWNLLDPLSVKSRLLDCFVFSLTWHRLMKHWGNKTEPVFWWVQEVFITWNRNISLICVFVFRSSIRATGHLLLTKVKEDTFKTAKPVWPVMTGWLLNTVLHTSVDHMSYHIFITCCVCLQCYSWTEINSLNLDFRLFKKIKNK